MARRKLRSCWDAICRKILGLSWDNGKENVNYYDAAV